MAVSNGANAATTRFIAVPPELASIRKKVTNIIIDPSARNIDLASVCLAPYTRYECFASVAASLSCAAMHSHPAGPQWQEGPDGNDYFYQMTFKLAGFVITKDWIYYIDDNGIPRFKAHRTG